MRSIASFIIRASAFITKELVEILRQTRLILALILGPFLILLLFGLGFKNEARVLRTLFVVPVDESQAAQQIEQYATTLGPQLDYRGVTTDEGQAMRMLGRGEIDVVAVIPGQIEEQIRESKQPPVTLYHREIDPLQASYVQYFAEIYVAELNRRILMQSAAKGQAEAATVQQDLQAAKASTHAMRLAFEAGDAGAGKQHQQETQRSLDALTIGVGASLGLLQGIEENMGTGGGAEGDNAGQAGRILGMLNSVSSDNESLANPDTNKTEYSQEAQRAATMEQNLDELDKELTDFRKIDPNVLVSPFKSEAQNVTGITLNSSDFFSPGVIVLLLQHMAVTFAALSLVRERISGAMELFRVSPISAFEVLLGKYISYLFLGSLIAAIISALVVFLLKVPMLGDWGQYALVLLGVLFASLGIGFILSLLSETNSQAVQYSMLILLFSIFFSGFFLDLRSMQPAMQYAAYAIPATYGMRLLQEIMFRANTLLTMPNYLLIGGLLAIGLLLFIISWVMLHRQMKLH